MTINCKGKLIDLNSPKVMGIINTTPNSFYAESRKTSEKDILKQVEKMLKDGANFIDVGGYSTPPGAPKVEETEELNRVLPAIENILKNFPEALISVDTFRANVAEKSIEAGAAIINDISAGNLDPEMMKTVAKHQVPYIMMHMRGTPQTMKDLNQYDDLLQEILFYFSEKVSEARALGINDLIVDPGFGFAKNIAQNFELLSKMELFKTLDLPILAGLSRKSLIYKTLNTSAQEALNGTTFLNTIALNKGANILRVHDVKEAVECTKLYAELNK
ncbi:dihydropteroate synthase [Salegentibacter sp. BDJ18]|jgi:dihydropteroate synthase|uniref:dihydropteroate synthase n=1 Tax=Salegentibacter sp. BDJ18 TaxID=2816376 RepID=UPI001AAE3028|nr:dihydropteroate synthase [Salegentibacter sp. BDJ18]MBO2546135.1 dihydropteroate synthase [Salegentibacter sp. BDJ18]|tara:strand:+ start:1984 stop:2808 length:825 start_codon:yes stop_codon:yes gene_type:complete